MFLTLLISAFLAGVMPSGETVSGAPRDTVSSVLPDSTPVMPEFTLYFRRNQTTIDKDYLGNESQQEDIRAILQRSHQPDSIFIYAWASPEGRYEHNVWLSQKRAEAARDFILAHSSYSPSRIVIQKRDENWPGLRQAVQQFYDADNRQEVLDILYRQGLTGTEREQALKDLDGGKTHAYLIETLMKPLRSAVIFFRESRPYVRPAEIEYGLLTFPTPVSDLAARPEVTPYIPAEPEPEPEVQAEYAKRTIVAVKTNALYDMALALNYAVEVPIGKHFSVQWEHYFPWWASTKELKYCLQYLTLGGEFRWWFAPKTKPETQDRMLRDVLQGHFVGVYGLWGKSDIQWKRALGMYQCYPIVSAGLTYGYSFPLTKHWNMELSVSAGYARIPYQHYTPSEDWQFLWRDRNKEGVLHYFGPTQVKVSLVRPIVIKYRVK